MDPKPISIIKTQLPRYLAEVKEKHSENAKAIAFTSFLKPIFGIESQDLDFEVPVKTSVFQMRGRIDCVFGDLIIEFKKDLRTGIKEAKEELKKYFQSYHEKSRKDFVGMVNDGINFKVFHPVFKENQVIDVEEVDELNMEKSSAEQIYLWFDSYFFSREKVIPTSLDIKRRFGLDSPTFVSVLRKLEILFEKIQSFKPAVLKYDNWNRYLEIIYGNKPNEKKLFFKHTYLSNLVKLLVYVKISKGKPKQFDEIVPILFGNTFEQAGIKNFIEEDFFAWILSAPIRKQSSKIFYDLLQEIYVYDLDKIGEDVLKELYQELVDPDVRKLLGEFYTPDWLAEHMIEQVLQKNAELSVMDPSCGSGTFLFKTIQYKIDALLNKGWEKPKILEHIIENVIGFDVHPLAVIISKTNYLLALKELLHQRKSSISIPVYLSDSLKVPTKTIDVSTALTAFEFEALDKKFTFPLSIVQDISKMDYIIDKMKNHGSEYVNIINKVKNSSLSINLTETRNNLLNSFERTLLAQNDEEKSILMYNIRTLFDLIEKESDGIWTYVLRNMYRPVSISYKKVDVLMGNPPWLALQFMKNLQYQDYLKSRSKNYGLTDPKKVQNITHLELATLFFCQTTDAYLKDNGTIAFVMPRSVLVGSQHENFLKFKKPTVKLTRIYDLEESKHTKVIPLFKIPSCVLVATKGNQTVYPVRRDVFSGKLNGSNEQFEEAKKNLKIEKSDFTPAKRSQKVSYYYDKFSQGATIVPGCFWFVNIKSDSFLGFNPQCPFVVSEENKNAKLPWSKIKMEESVEEQFIFTTIVSNDIVPFGYRRKKLVVFPVFIKNGTTELILSSNQDDVFQYNMSKYLSKAENFWQKYATAKSKNMTIYDRLNYQNGLTKQNLTSKFKVLYVSSATYMTSCVVKADENYTISVMENNFTASGLFADSTTYWFDTESEKEAYYLSSILNSKILDEKIKPHQARGAFGGARHIHKIPLSFGIPQYNKKNPLHNELADLGKQCHQKTPKILQSLSLNSIGKIRSIIRDELSPEYKKIDKIVSQFFT